MVDSDKVWLPDESRHERQMIFIDKVVLNEVPHDASPSFDQKSLDASLFEGTNDLGSDWIFTGSFFELDDLGEFLESLEAGFLHAG